MFTVGITITGLVQGVFFRKYTVETALKFSINGYVMNTLEGNVYIVATGEENAIKAFTAWCHTGSPLSKVKEVKVENLPYRAFEKFVIRFS